MNARVAALAVAILGMAGMTAAAQNYPPYSNYPPPYSAQPGANRGAPAADDDDDLAPLPAPGPYGRPSGYPTDVQRPPGAIQREALPPPGAGTPYPGYAAAPPDGSAPPGPPGRYSYGPWEPVRPPADIYGRPLPPGAAPNSGRPMEITPGQGGYAALPPDDQPETGQPRELPPQFRRQVVTYPTREPAGTIIIDTPNTFLYLVLGNGTALRYGIGVGREGFTWAGREKISKMSEWPDWHPPKEMIDRQPYLPRFMAGGESNPLGARALYLGNTLYRIHGTNQPSTIGSFVSSGCIRLTNADIEDLYGRVTVGTKVVVLPGRAPPESTASVR
jgi:lipoprotein-anchoring transpeptidase ErfK/SrfK